MNLLKVTTLPVRQTLENNSNIFAYIWPENEYFAINQEKKTYIPFMNENMKKCKEYYEILVCKDHEPIREIKENSACEIKIASNSGILNIEDCNIKIAQIHDIFWIK